MKDFVGLNKLSIVENDKSQRQPLVHEPFSFGTPPSLPLSVSIELYSQEHHL